MKSKPNQALVSVITPFYNAVNSIATFVDSISKQTIKNSLEIIFVDDASTDNSRVILEKRLSKIPSLDYQLLSQTHSGPAQARNYAAMQAHGSIFVFLDIDMTFEPTVIANLINPILSGQCKGTSTNNERVKNWHQPWARFWNYQYTKQTSLFRVDQSRREDKVFRAILASEFNRVGGFESQGYTDDWTLSQKLHYKACIVPTSAIFHVNPADAAAVLSQARWIGKRKYKLGILGQLLALTRASLPLTLIIGLVQSLKLRNFEYLKFKIVYNAGIRHGIKLALNHKSINK